MVRVRRGLPKASGTAFVEIVLGVLHRWTRGRAWNTAIEGVGTSQNTYEDLVTAIIIRTVLVITHLVPCIVSND